MRIRSVLKHSTMAVLEGALIASLVVGLMAGTALAGRGGGHGKPPRGTGGSGSISLVTPPVVDNNSNGAANWHDVVRFNVSTTSTTSPYVNLYCYQNGVFVVGGAEGYFAGALDDGNFGLYGGSWDGGAANCTAKLVDGSGSVLGSTSFDVGA